MKITCECGREIEIHPEKILGAAGGKKSKRTITPKQRKKMQEGKERKREHDLPQIQ